MTDAKVMEAPLEPPLDPATEQPVTTKKRGRPKGSGKAKAQKDDSTPKQIGKSFNGAEQMRKALAETYASVGVGLQMVPSPRVRNAGMAVMQQHEKCANSLVMLAEQDPAIRRALERAMTGSAWGAVLTAHAPIIFALVGPSLTSMTGGGGGAASSVGSRVQRKAPPPPPPPTPPQTPGMAPNDVPPNPAFSDVPPNPAFGDVK